LKTILIADDEAHLRLLVRKTLAEEDYRIVEAADGQEALARARKDRPDLLILDWMMPRLTGIQVLEQLAGDPDCAETRVIMLTARTQGVDRNLAIAQGVRAYLVKPFSPLELIQLVERVLEEDA
jgi:two-component system, OmpR family, phosphate regulon response regulator PhoB